MDYSVQTSTQSSLLHNNPRNERNKTEKMFFLFSSFFHFIVFRLLFITLFHSADFDCAALNSSADAEIPYVNCVYEYEIKLKNH